MLVARRDRAWVNVLDDVILGDSIHAQEAPAAADASGCAPPPLPQAPKKKNRDACIGLSHNTFETVPTTWCLTGAAAFNGDARPASLMCGRRLHREDLFANLRRLTQPCPLGCTGPQCSRRTTGPHGPHIGVLGMRSARTVLYLKTEKVGNSVQVGMEG